jgi:TonB family protein
MITIRERTDINHSRLLILCLLLSLCLHLALLLPTRGERHTETVDRLEVDFFHPAVDRTALQAPRPIKYNVPEIPNTSDVQPYDLGREPGPPHPIRTTGLREFDSPSIELPKTWDPQDTRVLEPPKTTPRLQTGVPRQDPVEAYLGALKKQIELNKAYPAFSRRKGEEGRVVVCFFVNCQGGLESTGIVKSSGYVHLDEAAVRAVRCSSPFPPPPCADREPLMFSVVLAFELAG